MKSGGFGIGKKQSRPETPKRTAPPTTTDLTQLLASSQKNKEKMFSLSWQPSTEKDTQFTLSVVNSASQRDRRGWSTSAIENNALGEAEWTLFRESDNERRQIWTMHSSDAQLILTLMEEYLQTAPAAGLSSSNAMQIEQYDAALPFDQAFAPQAAALEPQIPASMSESGVRSRATAKTVPAEGNLRKMSVQTIVELFNANKTTGRLICETGTVQAEVFFISGEPVHGKSCHSFYDDRDKIGDAVLVDLLTWRDGNFKFQDGWPAASRSIDKPLHLFLAGEVVVCEPAAASAPAAASSFPGAGATTQAPAANLPAASPPPASSPAPSQAADAFAGSGAQGGRAATSIANISDLADDFSNIDDLIAETYAGLVESTGILRYGMFLMLARGEFLRQSQFCMASIELSIGGRQLPDEFMPVIGGCFESVCQPLDVLAHAGPSRLVVLFPNSIAVAASNTLRQFISNVQTTPLDSNTHGNSLRIAIGLAEIPRDGSDIKDVLDFASKLRRAATPERKVVSTAG